MSPRAPFAIRPLGPVWRATLGSLIALGLVAAVLIWFGAWVSALEVTVLALLFMLLADRRKLSALWHWLDSRGKRPLPAAPGIWDDVFARLYREARTNQDQQAALSVGLENFRRAAQALPDGVVILDRDNQIAWLNRQASGHLGLQVAADTGQNITNLLRAPDFLAYLEGGTWDPPILVRLRGGRPTGDRLMSLQLIAYGDGQKLLLSRDVTKIEKLETMRRDFVANVSHELKTPLTVLSGFLETIRELPLTPGQIGEYLALMSTQAHRMENLVADLLTLSALEADSPPALQDIDMGALLGKVQDTALQLSQGRHRIEFEVTPGLHLRGAETEIASALSNLVSNAVHYTPADGRITVRWAPAAEGTGARFTVTDTGIGIAAAHLPRLTERFYRVDRGRSRESGGTGLGLAIVKHVLTRHQARLEITSTVGTGSTFAAEFPEERVRHGAPAGAAVPARP